MGKIWTSEEGSGEQQPGGRVETSVCQTLLRGQMLIGQDGKLIKANTAQSEPESDMIAFFYYSGWQCRCTVYLMWHSYTPWRENVSTLLMLKERTQVILVPGLVGWQLNWTELYTSKNCLAEKYSMKKSSLFEQKSLNDFPLLWTWKIWIWDRLLWAWRDSEEGPGVVSWVTKTLLQLKLCEN